MRALLALALVVLVAGCSDSDGGSETTTTTSVTTTTDITPQPQVVDLAVRLTGAYPVNIAYSPSTLNAPAGSMINVTFTNSDQAPLMSHDWVLEGVEGAATALAANGETVSVLFAAPEPGEYAFYCSVQGHRDNGMEGTLTIA
jgi:plastocyanin